MTDSEDIHARLERFKAIRAGLARLMAELPVLPDRRDTIAHEAWGLYVVALLHRIDDLPRAKRAGSRVALWEIDRLAALALAAFVHIHEMHKEALAAIESSIGDAMHPLKLADQLPDLIDATQRARGVVPAAPPARDLNRKRRAERVTIAAAKVFQRLTGKEVGRSVLSVPFKPGRRRSIDAGPFVRFLSGVFKVLQIRASAAAQIKLLLQKTVP